MGLALASIPLQPPGDLVPEICLGLGNRETSEATCICTEVAISTSLEIPPFLAWRSPLRLLDRWADSSPRTMGHHTGTSRASHAFSASPAEHPLHEFWREGLSSQCWTGSFYLTLTSIRGQWPGLQRSFPGHSLEVIANSQGRTRKSSSNPSGNAQLLSFTHVR